MYSFFIFIFSIFVVVLVLKRRYYLTKKDIELQKNVLAQDNKNKETESREQKLLQYFKKLTAISKASQVKKIKSNKNLRILDLIKQSENFIARNKLDESKKALMEIISLEENNIEANKRLGLIYIHLGEHIKAEFIFRKLTSIKEDSSFYSNLALTLYHQGKLEEAKLFYEKAISLDRSRVGRFVSLGQVYHELKEYDKALDQFEHALKMESKNIEFIFIVADYYEMKHNFAKAVELYQKALKIDPYNKEALKKISDYNIKV